MKHPGVNRAIPGAILGFIIGELLVFGLRSLQGLPPWDPGVAIVLAPFTLMAGWMWGVGAFNPKLSEHGEHHAEETAIVKVDDDGNEIVVHEAEEHHAEDEAQPVEVFFAEIWRAISLPLVVVLLVFGFANIPGGFYLAVVDEPSASPSAFDSSIVLNIPFVGMVETTQMVLFLAFVGWLALSMLIFAGALALFFYKGHEQIVVASQIEPGPRQTTPPAPVRALGRGAKNTARSLRKNLPKVLGNK